MSRGPRILIVEDEFLIRLTLAEALTDAGFEVTEAGDGEEAAALLRAQPPFDVMLTDLQLPGRLHGGDVARLARTDTPGLPVIFVSGRPMPPGRARSAADVLIAKPYLPSEVCAAALRLVAGPPVAPL
jgi:CheY-like chemotaxis protein